MTWETIFFIYTINTNMVLDAMYSIIFLSVFFHFAKDSNCFLEIRRYLLKLCTLRRHVSDIQDEPPPPSLFYCNTSCWGESTSDVTYCSCDIPVLSLNLLTFKDPRHRFHVIDSLYQEQVTPLQGSLNVIFKLYPSSSIILLNLQYGDG